MEANLLSEETEFLKTLNARLKDPTKSDVAINEAISKYNLYMDTVRKPDTSNDEASVINDALLVTEASNILATLFNHINEETKKYRTSLGQIFEHLRTGQGGGSKIRKLRRTRRQIIQHPTLE